MPYTVSPRTRLQRAVLRPLFRLIFHVVSSVHIDGREHIPKSGAYLIVFNHVSLFDPPFVVAFWPVAVEAAGAVDLWSRRGISTLVRLYGGIQVHREQYDRQVVDDMISVLQTGRPLVLAPEGGRSHRPGMRRALPGVAHVIEAAGGVPVLPVGVVGATDDFLARGLRGQRPKISMHIGPLVYVPPLEGRGAARRQSRQENADLIMHHVAALLPPEYRGVYATDLPADEVAA